MVKKFEEFINERLWKSGIERSQTDERRLGDPLKEGVFIELKNGRLIDQKDWEQSDKTESDIKGIYVSDGERKITLSLKQSPQNIQLSTEYEFPKDYPKSQEDGKLCQKWMEEHCPDLSDFPAFEYCKEQGGYLMSYEEGKLLRKYYSEITGTAGRLKKNHIDADGIVTDTVVFLEDGSFRLRTWDKYGGDGEKVKVIGIERHDMFGSLWTSSVYNINAFYMRVGIGRISFIDSNPITNQCTIRPAIY